MNGIQKVKKPIRWGKWLLGLTIFLVLSFIFSENCMKSMTFESKKSSIETELKNGLPVGSNLKKVLKYLDSRKIEHSPYDPKKYSLGAIVRNVERKNFLIIDIYIL